MELANRRALVTGGGVRLGRAVALALAGAGCDVAVHYGRSAGGAEETRDRIRDLGRRATALPADLADPAAPATLVESAVEALGGLDVLVNSAAVFPSGGLADTDLGSWEGVMAVNLRAPFFLCQAFARHLAGRDPGAIVNVLDGRVFRPGGDHLAYRLSKAALHHLSESLAVALAPRIRVNAVALGAILPPPGEGPDYLERLAAERVPLRRPGNAAAVSDAVLYLLRQDFVTGVTLRLDGGEFL